jgi:hypothetical protein
MSAHLPPDRPGTAPAAPGGHTARPVDRRDPFPTGLQKAGAASGILFVVFVILSIALGGGDSPDRGAPLGEYEQYVADNSGKLKLGLLFSLLSAFALLWFSGVLREALGRAETVARGFTRLSGVAFAGGIVAAIAIVLLAAIRTAAIAEDDLGGEAIRTIVLIADSTGALFPLGFAALLVPAGLLMLRTIGFPTWLGIVGLVAGAGYLLLFFYALVLDQDDSVLDVLWPIAFLGLLIWSVGTSVHLVRRVGAEDVAARARVD